MSAFRFRSTIIAILFGASLLGGCSNRLGDTSEGLIPVAPAPIVAPDPEDPDPVFPPTGGEDRLRVIRVIPGSGPFAGGNQAIVRGSGFDEESFVRVGGRLVQPAETTFIDASRLGIILPAGDPGPADVSVEVQGETVTLPDGYLYEPIAVDPNRGSTSGGTLINITAGDSLFQDSDRVEVGGQPCADVDVISETRITCKSPPYAVATVDVAVIKEDGRELTASDAFSYYDTSDPFGGGLGGGSIVGSLNITAFDAFTGAPITDVYVVLGEDLETEHQGLTNLVGQITFSGDNLLGEQTVHLAKHCYEKTTFVTFDATEVTAFMTPWMDPMCGEGSGGGGFGRGVEGSTVAGELVFLGPNEYGPNPWDNVPPARDDEERVAYVYTTQRCAGLGGGCRNPDPSLGASRQRVSELGSIAGELGFPYKIFARPAGLAVYALAGLENTRTGEFIPYIMGATRNILAGPGEDVEGVNILMNIPLDHTLEVRIDDLPNAARTGPDRINVSADIDLGGEGVITRAVNDELMDFVTKSSADQLFKLWAQPALQGTLSDGRYRIEAGWYTGDFGAPPMTAVVHAGVRTLDDEFLINDFIGIPQALAPAYGEQFPEDRVLRWENTGDEPSFYVVQMIGSNGQPAWTHYVPGGTHQAPIPDLSSIPEISDVTDGLVTWTIYGIRVDGFNFDEFSYRHLQSRYWTGWSTDTFTAQR